MKGYCTIDDVKNYTLTDVEDSFNSQIELWISSIEAYIDKTTGRNFIADENDSSRFFDGNGKSEMYIDECVEVTSVVIKDVMGDIMSVLAEGSYFLTYPYNDYPIRKVIIKSYNEKGFLAFPSGQKNIEVEAKWGYSVQVPDQIKLATTILVSGIMNVSNQAPGKVKTESIGDYQVTYRDSQWSDFELAKQIIGEFTKYNV